jgi:Kef-type K+ transport system membrane component KefB
MHLLAFEAPHGPAWLFLGVGAAVVLGPVAATWLRLPTIIGLLAGGLAIGPEGLGIVPATDPTVPALGQLGLLYLMFSAGAELDLVLFRRVRRAAVTFGLTTFACPMALGFSAGWLLDRSVPASLLLGSLWASHTLVTYPIVRKAGLSGNRAVASAVGATVITDTLSLLVLAGVSGSVTGDSGLTAVLGSLLLGLVGLAVYAGVVLPRLAQWFFRRPGHGQAERFAFLLVALLSSAVVAEMGGIEGLVGAFFAGLGINRLVQRDEGLMERVEFFGSSVLVPLFLVSVGLLIDPSVMVRPSTLALAAVFCAAVVGGKLVAALLARPLLGFTPGESQLMFGLTLSQAAATLAATTVGFDIGLFGEQVVNAVLVVILVTLLIAAVVTERSVSGVGAAPAGADMVMTERQAP